MSPHKMLEQARAAVANLGLEEYSESILELRRKGYSYRQIAEFLSERGLATEHTAVYRLVAKKKNSLLRTAISKGK
jgi:transposase-like protein